MITIKNINVRITETQEQKIKQSGLNTSEYVRKCIDFYDLRRENAYRYSRLSAIEECIESLKTIKKEESEKIFTETPLYKIDENVKKNDEKKFYKCNENVKNLYKTDANALRDVMQFDEESLYNDEENVKKMCDDEYYVYYGKYTSLLSKMLNLHNVIPQDTRTMITSQTATTKREFDEYIRKYRDEIKEQEYNFDRIKVPDKHILRISKNNSLQKL